MIRITTKLSLSLIIATAVLFSCSKSQNEVKPKVLHNPVTIQGTQYGTVTIGDLTWTTENYNGPGGTNYSNGANDPVYGKLYTFAEAQAVTLPAGWRLPTEDDYQYLEYYDNQNPKTLMATTGWNLGEGTDSLNFNAVATGYYVNGAYTGKGTETAFICTTVLSTVPSLETFTIFQFTSNGVLTTYGFESPVLKTIATDRGSVRFVKTDN